MPILENEAAWSTTAATNAGVDTGINWAENQDAATVNNSARGMMAARRKAALDQGGWILATGTANALIVATNQGYTAPLLLAGARLLVRAAAVNTSGTVTIAVDGLTPANIKRGDGSALAIGDIQVGTPLDLIYNTGSSEWRAVNMASSATVIPIGSVNAFAGSAAPTGWLLCNAAAVSRTTYASLFAVLGTIYGAGDGSTTFNVPDLRGRFVAGLDSGTGRLTGAYTGGLSATLGAVGGEQGHTLNASEQASMSVSASGSSSVTVSVSVTVPDTSIYGNITARNTATAFGVGSMARGNQTGTADYTNFDLHMPATTASGSGSGSGSASVTGTAFGGGLAHNAVPPAIALNYIIFAGV